MRPRKRASGQCGGNLTSAEVLSQHKREKLTTGSMYTPGGFRVTDSLVGVLFHLPGHGFL